MTKQRLDDLNPGTTLMSTATSPSLPLMLVARAGPAPRNDVQPKTVVECRAKTKVSCSGRTGH